MLWLLAACNGRDVRPPPVEPTDTGTSTSYAESGNGAVYVVPGSTL